MDQITNAISRNIVDSLPRVIGWTIENNSDEPIEVPFVWPGKGPKFVEKTDLCSITSKSGSHYSIEELHTFFWNHVAKGHLRINILNGIAEDMVEFIMEETRYPTGFIAVTMDTIKRSENDLNLFAYDFKGEFILDVTSRWCIKLKAKGKVSINFIISSISAGSRYHQMPEGAVIVDPSRIKWWQLWKRLKGYFSKPSYKFST